MLVEQISKNSRLNFFYVTADESALRDLIWLREQWEIARRYCSRNSKGVLLILDEIQKISNWSETVKKFWDEDTRNKIPIKVLLLGSSPLLIQTGLTESLAGRFELNYIPHWSYSEMKKAFGFSLDQFIFYGGYPGAIDFIKDRKRWRNYILDGLIEPTLSKDILLMVRIDKPALLRRLFELSCHFSGQILSYQKMVGQLQDVGNTTTLAHYLELLSGVGLVGGLQKFSGSKIKQKGSSPKLQVYNTGLMSVELGISLVEVREKP